MKNDTTMVTPNFDRINPQLCINAKLRRLHRLIDAVYQKKIRPFGLRGSMLSILFIIGKREHINQKAIADMLVLDQSTMSRDIKRLKDKGWVAIIKGQDARHSELQLTPEGKVLLEEIAPVWEQLNHSIHQILGQFNIQQIDVLTATIQANIENLKQKV